MRWWRLREHGFGSLPLVLPPRLIFLLVFSFILLLLLSFDLRVLWAGEALLINGKCRMACGETQELSLMNHRSGRAYTWELVSGGGELLGASGERVGYRAPEANPGCGQDPLIRVNDSEGHTGEIRIAVNCYSGNERACWTDEDYSISPYTVPYSKRLYYFRKSYTCAGAVLGSYKYSCVCGGTWCEDTVPLQVDFGCYNPGGYTMCSAFYCHDIDEDCDLWGSWEHGCIGDGRTVAMKEGGCCPEVLLPGYVLKDPVPEDLELGKDPLANTPVCDPSLKGNPIRITDGNNIETEEDLFFGSPFRGGLRWKRTYGSRSKGTGALGYGWTHGFGAVLDVSYVWKRETYLRIVDETGRGVYFKDGGGGESLGAFKERSRVRLVDGVYEWMRLDGSRYGFGGEGRLGWIEDPVGNRQILSYDGRGRLVQVRDEASGRSLTLGYDDEGRITAIHGPVTEGVSDGVWVRYGYDGNGNLSLVSYADGSGFRYAYEDPRDAHNLTEKRNGAGHLLSRWTYDDEDRAVGNVTRDGRGVSIRYVSENEVRVTDAYGVMRTYRMWDTAGGRKRVTDIEGPEGCATCGEEVVRLEYDGDLNVIEVAYANGRVDQYGDFDGRGNAGTVRQAVGTDGERVIRYVYHSETDGVLSRRERSVLGEGEKVTVWDHDDDGDEDANEAPTRLARKVIERGYTRDIEGAVLSFEYTTRVSYDPKGNVTEMDGPRPGREDGVGFSYDPVTGDLVEVSLPLVGAVRFEGYDGAGRLGRWVDPNGQGVRYAYDGRGRISSVTQEADGGQTAYAYHLSGELSGVTDPDGVGVVFLYDDLYGRLVRVEDGIGNSIRYAYDAEGNRTQVSYHNSEDERAYYRSYEFRGPQHPGRLWKEIGPDGAVTEYGYDVMGNVAWVKDPMGRERRYGYDLFGRLGEVREPGEVLTGYAYDRHGNPAQVVDPEGRVTRYVFDDLGRLLETESPDAGKTVYAYDEAGNLTEKRDAGGSLVVYGYDVLNRLTGVEYRGGEGEDVVYRYDEGENGRGRRTGMRDGLGETGYGYDAKGNLIREMRVLGEERDVTEYGFSAGGRLVRIGYPSGLEVRYGLDESGEVREVEARFLGRTYALADEGVSLPFGPKGAMRLGNGIERVWGYDESYRVRSIEEGSVLGLSYIYDAAGNVTGIENRVDASRTLAFSYDALNRLVGASGIYGTIGYTYDRTGNRLTRSHGGETEHYGYVPGTNRLLGITGPRGERGFRYDANGNTVGAGELSLGYSPSDRLREVRRGGEVLGEYRYNGKGERVLKRAGGRDAAFHYDPSGRLLGVRGEGDAGVTNYVYLDGGLLAAAEVPDGDLAGKDADGDGDADGADLAWLAVACADGEGPELAGFAGVFGRADLHVLRLFWFHTDHLGTPLMMTDKEAKVVWQADYEPFGETEILTGAVNNPLRFPGQYHDRETGFHYNYFRYYDPRAGRYLTPDPIGQAGGMNLYPYVLNNPVNHTDPKGLLIAPWHFAVTYAAARNSGYSVSESLKLARIVAAEDRNSLDKSADAANVHGMRGRVEIIPGEYRYQTRNEAFYGTMDIICRADPLSSALHALQDLPGHDLASMEDFGLNWYTIKHVFRDIFDIVWIYAAYQKTKHFLQAEQPCE